MSIARRASIAALMLAPMLALTGVTAIAGVLDPDCTAQKAAKGAAAKATVGVGGRCSPGEAVKDTAKRTAGATGKADPVDKARGKAPEGDNKVKK